MTKKVEDDLRKLSLEIRLFEETAGALQSRINMVNAVITELTYANMTLEGLEKHKGDEELFVPIGGTSYIKARLQDPDKVIVGMGAGVSVEKTLLEAKEIIKKRLEEFEKTRMALQQRFTQIVQKINADRARFEELMAELRKGKASRNV